ncbi:MAG: NfeD family protein [Planctomycetota bacterium]
MSVALAQAATGAAPNEAYLMWGFILAAAALGLLLIELLIPSGGLLGLLCGIAAIGSIVAFFQYDTTFGIAALLAYIILTPILLVFFFKLWIHSPLAKRMVLGGDVQGQTDGEQDTLKTAEKARLKRIEELRQLIGAEGVTETALRPVGFVKIDGQRLDAMAESGIVEANTPVVVTDVYDNQVKVRPRTT